MTICQLDREFGHLGRVANSLFGVAIGRVGMKAALPDRYMIECLKLAGNTTSSKNDFGKEERPITRQFCLVLDNGPGTRSAIMTGLVFLLFLMWALSSMAATYYVNSSTGSDSAAGSSAAPWRTLTTSIGKLAAGDTLSCTGSWSITSQYLCSTPNIKILGNGTSTIDLKPVSGTGTLGFMGSGTVFRGFNILETVAPSAGGQVLMLFYSAHNSVVADCSIHDIPAQNIDDEIIFLVNANSCVFSNLNFYNIVDRDIFRAWGIGNKWTSCTFSNLTHVSPTPHPDIIQTWWTGDPVWSNVVERCYYVKCSQALFQLKGTPDNVTCHPGQEGYWAIRNCIFNNCPSWPIISTDNFRFYNNLVYKSGSGTGPTLLLADPCLNHGKYYNNVHINCTSLQNNAYNLGPNYTEGNNAFTASGLSWGGASDFVTTEVACKFVNAAAGNFRLQAGSSLIGKGFNLITDSSMSNVDADGNIRPSAGAWDIGPFQYSAASAANQPPSVNAGADLNLFLPTNSVTLNGSATDPEGAPLTLRWSCVSGPGVVSFASPASAITTVTFPTNLGTYVFQLSASDDTNIGLGRCTRDHECISPARRRES